MFYIRDAFHDFVPFVQFKKRKRHPWRSVATLLKVAFLHVCFSRFLNCGNGINSRKASYICQTLLQILSQLKWFFSYFLVKSRETKLKIALTRITLESILDAILKSRIYSNRFFISATF